MCELIGIYSSTTKTQIPKDNKMKSDLLEEVILIEQKKAVTYQKVSKSIKLGAI